MINTNIKVCSEHIKSEDFFSGGENPQAARCMLKMIAVPSLFPCSVSKECTIITSQRAALVLEIDSNKESASSGPSLNEFCEIDAEYIDCNSADYLKAKVAELCDHLVAKSQT